MFETERGSFAVCLECIFDSQEGEIGEVVESHENNKCRAVEKKKVMTNLR